MPSRTLRRLEFHLWWTMLDEEARQQCLGQLRARRQRVWVMVPSPVKARPVVIGAGG